MVRGFLHGGFLGACVAGTAAVVLLTIAMTVNGRTPDADDLLFLVLAFGLMGGGVGAAIGAARTSAPALRMVLARKRVLRERAPQGPDLRLRLSVAALYAVALASLGSVVVIGSVGRYDVTSLVNAALPYDVGPLQARLMLAGTIFVCAFAALGALSLQVTRAGLGGAERRLLAAAGFLWGILALPALGVIVG